MTRAVLIGDGQLELFRELDHLVSYLEPPEAESGKYKAFTEDGVRWRLAVETIDKGGIMSASYRNTVPIKENLGIEVRNELLREIESFFTRCEVTGVTIDIDNMFDVIQNKYGFTV